MDLAENSKKRLQEVNPPVGKVILVFTDIQSSTTIVSFFFQFNR